ncbi:MAG TPA: tetratricopeptide repeat protein [Acidobacteriota bacterium]|jgi:tetratricopeptide (TPR) repeat protein|nr:tetratricopeptide repeat protein [Acidobacteriota bacterium]HNU01802.1 tetratricopeptide repeat protein [Acidobacteriota bacterium]HPB27299.1 tetratricopeptide repeat protein [Acidobacteriota bacterium]HQO25886.1 tetratricopeptide repeat protein [Acidobacteriota bacterium]HQP73388.1 tetratricopeptide repeat protein [Acidobacteriota bacterium]
MTTTAIGHYQVDDAPAARDAYGALFAGTDSRTGDAVFVKALRPAGPGAADRASADAFGGLLHEALLPPRDEVAVGAERYAVVARPEGELLAACLDRLRRGGMAGRHQLLMIILGVARGVEQLHNRRLIHGQVNPAAIVARCQTPLQAFLLCFGAAEPLPGHCLVADNPFLQFVAREQLRGGGGQAADIYALGMLLYAAFSKHPPFAAATPWATAEQIMWGECLPFEPLLDDLPPAIGQAVAPYLEAVGAVAGKALHRDPRARYATVGEMIRLLDDLARRLAPVELGIQLYEARRFDLAAAVLAEATAGPDAARAHLFLGRVYGEGLGDYEKGVAAFRRALKENPALTSAREALADHYARFDHYALAKREILELLGASPDSIPLMIRYADILRRAGDADPAVNVLRRVVELNPYHLAARAQAIRLQIDRQQFQPAEAECNAALEVIQKVIHLSNLNPAEVAEIYTLRARLHRQRRMADRAMTWAHKALDVFPAHADAHVLLSELHLEAGQTEQAIEHFLAAMSLSSDQGKILEGLARLLDRPEFRQE